MTLTGKARVAGVIGWPVAHSRSPRLHGYWLKRYGIDGAYVPLPVKPEHAREAIRALPKLGLRGANVTIPLKEAALAACDETDEAARAIGAVNTLVCTDDGRLLGRNTDAFGFIEYLREAAPALALNGRRAVVLGAGGSARAVIYALAKAGAAEIAIVNRTPARAQELARDLGAVSTAKLGALAVTDLPHALKDAVLLANATSLGMAGQPPLEIALDPLSADAAVADLVYTPLETPLLKAAAARGLKAVDGLGMLIHQARPGFAAWFGVDPEPDAALRAHLLESFA